MELSIPAYFAPEIDSSTVCALLTGKNCETSAPSLAANTIARGVIIM